MSIENEPSYEELSRIAHCGLTGDESIVDGLRRERMNLFNAGFAWAETGRAGQPPRGPRPEQPYVRGVSRSQSDRYLGWKRCAAAYEAWLASGREGPTSKPCSDCSAWQTMNRALCISVNELAAALEELRKAEPSLYAVNHGILNSNMDALIELLTYDGQRTRAEEAVLCGEIPEEYRERTTREGPGEADMAVLAELAKPPSADVKET